MKNLSALSKKGIIIISAMLILLAGGLVIGLPSIYSDGGGGGMGGHKCGQQGPVESGISYVNIPILNNHHPKILTITKVYIAAPASPCYEETSGMMSSYCRSASETRVKEIKFGDAIASYSTSAHSNEGYCCCIGSTHHDDGHLYTLDTNYSFSGAKVLCRVTLDVATAPSGLYTVTYYFTIEGVSGEKSNTITFSL
ncbi:MAG: hypothetical protein KKC23_04235 [Proteobacteria bacterium]|nr:hypothetical protein [Pseudomonadota bacterium]